MDVVVALLSSRRSRSRTSDAVGALRRRRRGRRGVERVRVRSAAPVRLLERVLRETPRDPPPHRPALKKLRRPKRDRRTHLERPPKLLHRLLLPAHRRVPVHAVEQRQRVLVHRANERVLAAVRVAHLRLRPAEVGPRVELRLGHRLEKRGRRDVRVGRRVRRRRRQRRVGDVAPDESPPVRRRADQRVDAVRADADVEAEDGGPRDLDAVRARRAEEVLDPVDVVGAIRDGRDQVPGRDGPAEDPVVDREHRRVQLARRVVAREVDDVPSLPARSQVRQERGVSLREGREVGVLLPVRVPRVHSVAVRRARRDRGRARVVVVVVVAVVVVVLRVLARLDALALARGVRVVRGVVAVPGDRDDDVVVLARGVGTGGRRLLGVAHRVSELLRGGEELRVRVRRVRGDDRLELGERLAHFRRAHRRGERARARRRRRRGGVTRAREIATRENIFLSILKMLPSEACV
eukprot:31504-Pelagococcus_subviridis.AAC.8